MNDEYYDYHMFSSSIAAFHTEERFLGLFERGGIFVMDAFGRLWGFGIVDDEPMMSSQKPPISFEWAGPVR